MTSDRDTYPTVPGYKVGSPETSKAAAASMADGAKSIERKALAALADAGADGLTTDEGADRIGLPNPYMSRPRFSSLRAQGKIVDSGRRRTNASGRKAAVWILVEFALPDHSRGKGNV